MRVTLTKNAIAILINGYSGYGIGFDRRSSFSFPGGGVGQNVLIFEADMSSSAHINNKKKDILVLGEGPTQLLDYNGENSYLFANGTEICKFKVKDSTIVATPLCLGKVSKEWSVDYMKKTGFNGYIYNFSVDYDAIAIDNILDIYKHLMK